MIVSGLNENESQEREQGGIMWREIEFHLYRVHLLTLRFLGGNGDERSPPLSLSRMHFSVFLFFFLIICAFSLSVRSVFISSHPFVIFGANTPFNISITLIRPFQNDTRLFDV